MLQAGPADLTGGGLFAAAVTLLIAWLFYGRTLHLAATFFIGDVPSQLAANVAIAPAVVSILLQQYGRQSVGGLSAELGVGVVVVATLLADGLAASYVYRLEWSSTVPLVLLHFAFATVLGISLFNLLGIG